MTSPDIKKIRIQLEKILDREGIQYEKNGDMGSHRYVFPAGSTDIWLALAEKKDYSVLMFYSPLLVNVTEDDAAYAMVKLNHQLPFGSLVYNENENELGLSYMVAIDDLGQKELLVPLKVLQENADHIDDMLQEVIGGTRTEEKI